MSVSSRHCTLFISYLIIWLAVIVAAPAAIAAEVGRPDPEAGPTKVEVGVAILDIMEISGANQFFEANVFINLKWSDPRLAHDQERRTMSLDDVWHPDLRVLNRRGARPTFPEIVSVSPTGEVQYRQRMIGTFSQPLFLRDFPFDRQAFALRLFASAHAPSEIEFTIDPRSQVTDNPSVPDWDIVSWNIDTSVFRPLRGDPMAVAGVLVTFETERRKPYYIYKVIVPLILIVSMSWIVFWIDPQEFGPQVSVAVTTMLTLIAYRFAVGANIPNLDYMTRLDYFILGSTILVYLTLFQAVATSTITRIGHKPRALAIDRACRILFPSVFVLWTVETLWLRSVL